MQVGKHYFLPLQCTNEACKPTYKAWEVDSTDFRIAKVITINSSVDAMAEWIMREQGRDFYSREGQTYARAVQGDVLIYSTGTSIEVPSSTQVETHPDQEISPYLFFAKVFIPAGLLIIAFVLVFDRLNNKPKSS